MISGYNYRIYDFRVNTRNMSENVYNDLLSRLEFLCHGRKLYPFLMGLGMTTASTNRVKKGGEPTTNLLNILRDQENVNLNWFTTGKGAPYRVYRALSDAEAFDYLNTLLNDEPEQWRLTLVHSAAGQAIVLTMPAAMAIKDKTIDYTTVEIISGNIGAKTIERAQAPGAKSTQQLEMLPQDLNRLEKGWMSNRELIGWQEEPGILSQAEPITQTLKVADTPRAEYNVEQPVQEIVTLCSNYTTDQQEALRTLLALLKPVQGPDVEAPVTRQRTSHSTPAANASKEQNNN